MSYSTTIFWFNPQFDLQFQCIRNGILILYCSLFENLRKLRKPQNVPFRQVCQIVIKTALPPSNTNFTHIYMFYAKW